MIKYLGNQEIVDKKWDACIEHSVNCRLYAYSWYLNIVAPEWGALVMDDYQAVFPILSRKKMGVQYAFQPVFTQQLGLFTPLLLDAELVKSFLKVLFEHFPFIQINLNIHNALPQNFKYASSRLNHELDLVYPYSELTKAYSKNLKRNIKKAQKAELTIFKNLKPELLIQLFRDHKGKTLKAYSKSDYQTLNRLVYKAISLGKAEVWGTYTKNNELCAGAIFFRDARRLVFLFSASNDEAKNNGAIPYLLDSFIEAYSEEKMILDFEGSNDPNLARFYKSFGSSEIHYPHIYYNALPWYISFALKIKKALQNF